MNVGMRTCKGCGDLALCFDGYCSECNPAGASEISGAYAAWWNSDAGRLDRQYIAEQVLSELALELGEAGDQGDQVRGT